jgi:hypothetical protein
MRVTQRLLAISAFAICAGCGIGARAALIDFNAVGDLAANFTHEDPTPPYVEADSVGVGGSRGLSVNATTDTGATLQTSNYNFGPDGAKIQVSMFLHTAATLGTTGEDRIFELNLVGLNTNSPTAGHTGVGGKIEFLPNADGNDTVGVEFRRNNGDPPSSAGQDPGPTFFDIQPATWYKATFTATQGGGGTSIPVTMTLDDYGATGAALVTANVYSFSFTLTDTTAANSDTEVFGAFRVRNGTRLIDALDNYEIVQIAIPEPGTLALVGLALCGLSAKRRR